LVALKDKKNIEAEQIERESQKCSQVGLYRDKLKIKYQEILSSVNQTFNHYHKRLLVK